MCLSELSFARSAYAMPAADYISCAPGHLFWSKNFSLLHFCFQQLQAAARHPTNMVPTCVAQKTVSYIRQWVAASATRTPLAHGNWASEPQSHSTALHPHKGQDSKSFLSGGRLGPQGNESFTIYQSATDTASKDRGPLTPPPPPCPRTTLRKNQPLVPRSNSRITFFTRVVGVSCFWWT